MIEQDDVTTGRDPHRRRHRILMLILIWLAVYPTVTLLTYLTSGLDVPTFVRTFLTTLLTVPVITFLVVPNAKALISKADPKA
ncbi:hypothetical protein [uncultured Jannaschia sp.]|uniref:hypothetical protein n=1 Tax=uncultured Jannaschia sp. TaxID=293347 RepID=UPI00262ACD10|nr:hypothetical protein [uncultured Jannaschia sp.]